MVSDRELKLYKTKQGCLLEDRDCQFLVSGSKWDELVVRDDLHKFLQASVPTLPKLNLESRFVDAVLAPIGEHQEVWAAGVTYRRSREARIQESQSAGGGDFYDRVYNAPRPELFFKATSRRIIGPYGKVGIRQDAKWSVPEPELALLISPSAKILGYTIGNDMSARDIEGENPLYLPQAKIYNRSCALGPCILVSPDPLPRSTTIRLDILRQGNVSFSGTTTLAELKRELKQLIDFLYRENSFPYGCVLLTGTGIVPPDSFTLEHGDEIRIAIEGIGNLVNVVE